MTGCVNEDDVELSLGLAIGSGGRLRKCSEDVLKKDGILGRQEARKKQEVRRGAVLVDEDERVRKKAKSEFCFEWVDEGLNFVCKLLATSILHKFQSLK